MKVLFVVVLALNSLMVYSQAPLNENTNIGSMPTGISYQYGPGGSNSQNWIYPYGVKLSVWHDFTRNFEIVNTHKNSTATLAFRTYDQNANLWTAWREVIYKNNSGNVGIGTAAPSNMLEVKSPSGDKNPAIESENDQGVSSYFYTGRSGNVEISNKTVIENSSTNELLINPSGGNVGIGTATPNRRLTVESGGSTYLNVRGNSGVREVLLGVDQNGAILSAMTNHDLQIRAGNNSTKMIVKANGDIGIGTLNPQSKLAVDGQIIATEVKVLSDISVPDYVFEADYDLRTLEETQAFITKNKHLPEIPSAKEMETNGIDLGDMNMRLLKKIEELTLYIIDVNNRVNALETENYELKKEISTIKTN